MPRSNWIRCKKKQLRGRGGINETRLLMTCRQKVRNPTLPPTKNENVKASASWTAINHNMAADSQTNPPSKKNSISTLYSPLSTFTSPPPILFPLHSAPFSSPSTPSLQVLLVFPFPPFFLPLPFPSFLVSLPRFHILLCFSSFPKGNSRQRRRQCSEFAAYLQTCHKTLRFWSQSRTTCKTLFAPSQTWVAVKACLSQTSRHQV